MSVIYDPFSRFQRIIYVKVNLWQRLPEHFRRDVVSHLDYKSRCALRETSKNDMELVDSCPIFVRAVSIAFVCRTHMSATCWNTPNIQFNNNRDVAGHLLRILQHPKSVIGRLDMMAYAEGPNRISTAALNYLCSGLEALTSPARPFPIKAKYLGWTCYSNSYPSDAFQKIVNAVDPSVLEHVNINDSVYFEKNPEFPETLKACPKIEIENPIPFQEFMLNTDKLMVKLSSWRADDVVKMVESFLSRNPPLGSFFDLTSTVAIPSMDIFTKLKVPMYPMPRSMFRRPTHSHQFETKNPELELVLVSFLDGQNTCKVSGVVCRKREIEKDFIQSWD